MTEMYLQWAADMLNIEPEDLSDGLVARLRIVEDLARKAGSTLHVPSLVAYIVAEHEVGLERVVVDLLDRIASLEERVALRHKPS